MVMADSAHGPYPANKIRFRNTGHAFDISEATPFLGTDEMILVLLKDYLNAKADYQSTLLAFGRDNPMTDVAGDHADSAWCSLQARLFELKADKAALARTALLEKLNNKTCEARHELRVRRERSDQQTARQTIERRRKRARSEDFDNWLAFLILFVVLCKNPNLFSKWIMPHVETRSGFAG